MKKDEILEELKSNTGEYSTGWDLDEYITTKEFEEDICGYKFGCWYYHGN